MDGVLSSAGEQDITSARSSVVSDSLCTGFLVQWNLSIKDTLRKGHLSNEGTVCSPNHIELCTNLPLN